MKKNIAIFAILFVVLCAFQAKERAVHRSLSDDIEKVISSVDPDVHVGIEVASVKDEEKLYGKNAHHLFTPASSLKILTGAAALHILGVDYRFETKLLTDGRKRKHELKGNVYLQGAGDPELSLKQLEELVFALKLQGIQRIDGDICIDVTIFDEIAQGPGWMWDEGAYYYNSPIGALTVNHSCIDIWVRPNTKVSEPPMIYVRPRTSFAQVFSEAVVSEEENTISVERRWMTKENIIDIKGKLPHKAEPYYIAVPLEAPHFFTAHVFKEMLDKNDIGLSGEIKVKAAPETAKEFATVYSRPLSQIVEQMLKESDNLIADVLFKKIGQAKFGIPGTWSKGTKAVREFLSNQVGLDVDRIVIMDGSGASRYNLISPHHLTQALLWMKKQFSCSAEFCASFPIAGVDGTLWNRMEEPALKGQVRAKTGTMTGVSSLSGYATTQEGEELAFCILLSGFTNSAKEYKAKIEDKICASLVTYSVEN